MAFCLVAGKGGSIPDLKTIWKPGHWKKTGGLSPLSREVRESRGVQARELRVVDPGKQLSKGKLRLYRGFEDLGVLEGDRRAKCYL